MLPILNFFHVLILVLILCSWCFSLRSYPYGMLLIIVLLTSIPSPCLCSIFYSKFLSPNPGNPGFHSPVPAHPIPAPALCAPVLVPLLINSSLLLLLLNFFTILSYTWPPCHFWHISFVLPVFFSLFCYISPLDPVSSHIYSPLHFDFTRHNTNHTLWSAALLCFLFSSPSVVPCLPPLSLPWW